MESGGNGSKVGDNRTDVCHAGYHVVFVGPAVCIISTWLGTSSLSRLRQLRRINHLEQNFTLK